MNWWIGEILGDLIVLALFVIVLCTFSLLVLKAVDLWDDWWHGPGTTEDVPEWSSEDDGWRSQTDDASHAAKEKEGS